LIYEISNAFFIQFRSILADFILRLGFFMESITSTKSDKFTLLRRIFRPVLRILSIYIGTIMLVVCSANVILKAQEAPNRRAESEQVENISIDDLPFKNNHERNLIYASQLYNAGEREVALDVYNNMVAAYKSAGQKENEADVHEKLAYLFYDKDKQWASEERFVEEQKIWIRSHNIKTVEELTEYLRCMEGVDLIDRPEDNSRYDRNLLMIIDCLEENQSWAGALDWMNKYESFRNPKSATYNDRVDLIKFKKAEYYLTLKSYPEALKLYREVAFGFNKEEQSKFAAQALVKYNELLKKLGPELYGQLISKASLAEKNGDWEEALNTLIYAKRYAPNSGSHNQLVDAFKGRRRALLEKQLVTVNDALAKQQWVIARTALADCLKLAGSEVRGPGLLSLHRACLLAERAEKLAEQSKYGDAAEVLQEAAALAENKMPFQKRADEYEAKASENVNAKLTKVRELIAEGGLENISSAYGIISQILITEPEDAEASRSAASGLRDELVGKAVPVNLGEGIEMEFVLIPSGQFIMGSPKSEQARDNNEGLQRTVKLTNSFWITATEVTQAQYERLMSDNSGQFLGDRNPVEASWNDAVSFCRMLSEKTGYAVRLPTEAEWEYACRAGTDTRFSFGEDESELGDYAWFKENASDANEQYAHVVAQKQPNPWGLYDIYGNMWEWCSDYYGVNNRPSPIEIIDPKGPSEGKFRVLRGGSWFSAAKDCRSASRYWLAPDSSDNIVGFRVVIDVKYPHESIEDSEED
jgi:formylglycine-generating enzyme required for sulfatase activity